MLCKVCEKRMRSSLLHQSIGALLFQTASKEEGKGTACLISPNLILTCAHNIHDKNKGVDHTDFKFYLGVHGDSDHFYEIEAYKFLEQFTKCENKDKINYEYALMKLKQDIERPIKLTRFLKLDIFCEECQVY